MNGGLNFSGFDSGYSSKNKNSNFRKAGEAFTTGSNNSFNGSSVGNSSSKTSAYDKWMSFMGNQSNTGNSSSSNNISNSSSSSSSSSSSNNVQSWTPTEETKAASEKPEKSLAEIKSEKVRRNRQGEIVPLDEWNATWNPKGYYIKEDGSLHHPG